MASSVDLACHRLGLDLLPPSLPYLASGALASFGLQVISRLCSPAFFPRTYPSLSRATQLNWDAHVVAWGHSFYAVAAASWMLLDGDKFGVLGQDKVFGYERTAAHLLAVSTGYFLWDTVISSYMFLCNPSGGFAFVLHGVVCFVVFLTSFKPFLAYFGAVFLLWEVSTLFLNPQWFMDKLGLTGSKLQLANGIALLSTFFAFRIVFGALSSYRFFIATAAPGVDEKAGFLLVRTFWVLNVALGVLNLIWFNQMITSVRKRFRKSPSSERNPTANGTPNKKAA